MAPAERSHCSGYRDDKRASPHRAEPASALDITPIEAELLRTALEDDWVALLITLYESWGFCPRHAIGFAAIDLELRDRMFLFAILYEHLLEHAIKITRARPRTWRGIRHFLTPRTGCVICDRRAAGKSTGAPALADQVNQRRRLHQRLAESRPDWATRACPLCVDGGSGIVCRPHLLAGAKQDGLAEALGALYERVRRFSGSMTTRRTQTDRFDRFSWLETIGWFGGWEYPRQLLLEKRGDRDD